MSFLIGMTLNAQNLQSRLLKVSPENVAAFEAAAAKKTKMYNSKDGQPTYLTFKILTGPDAQHYVRMQTATNISEFDKIDVEGDENWQKTTGSLHTSEGNNILRANDSASYTPVNSPRVNHRRVLIYKIKAGMGDDFWRYRTRLVKALESAKWPKSVITLNCISGCDGDWVQVRYHHENFEDEYETIENAFPGVIKKYNELFGNDSYEQDNQRMRMSVEENRTRHLQLLPALSSPWK